MVDLSKITTSFALPIDYDETYHHYLKSIESLIEKITTPLFFSDQLIKKAKGKTPEDLKDLEPYFENLIKEIPLVYSTNFEKNQKSLAVILICSAKHTHGVGRFMCDLFSRWLIPGKQIPIVNTRSLAFQFKYYPKESFFFK